ncbi:MAG: PQQ-binding-like beta-propeller repeat protein, partial [Gimesia sp.]
MNRLLPPFSVRFYLSNLRARLLFCMSVILIFPCAYLLSNDEQGQPRIEQQQLALLDPPANNEVPNQSEPEKALFDERKALIHRIYRNRGLRTQLERAEQKFRNHEFTEGALQLEKLLDHQEDYFFWPDDQSRPSNFRQRTRTLFSTASPRTLSDYERISGPQANWLLEMARANNDIRIYEHLALRFFPLRAGFESLNYLAAYYLEQGNFEFAARYWDLMLDSRIHRSRMKSVHLLKAAIAYQQSKQEEKVANILSSYGEISVIFSGTRSTLTQAIQKLNTSLMQMPEQQNSGWFVSQGNSQRNQSTNASLPFLKPNWSHPIARTTHRAPLKTLRTWERKQTNANRSTAVVNSPIAVGDLVIYRDFEGIRAVEIESGKTSWIFKSEGSISSLIDRVANRIPSHATYSQNLPLEKFYNYGSIYGSLTSNGQHVFAIDYLPDAMPQTRQQLNLGLRRTTTHIPIVSRRGNQLIAVPVQYAAAQSNNNNKWGKDLPTSPNESSLNAKLTWKIDGYYFLGPPLPVGNQIYAIAEHENQISLLCINPQNGNIRWKQGIAYVNQPIRSDRNRSYRQCPLASSQGIIVCTTQIDTLIAVDATNGDLLWNYYYGEEDNYRRSSQKRYNNPISFGHPGLTSTPVIDQGRVYYLPTGSPYIHCIDLKTGLPLWNEVPREDGEYVAAVIDKTVMVVGSDYCRGRHIQDGSELWHLQVGPVTGKGILSHENYLLPIKAGSVLSIHIPTGSESGFTLSNATQISEILNREFKQTLQQGSDYAFQVLSDDSPKAKEARSSHRWSPGNLISHQGRIISLGLWQIDSFPQAEVMLTNLPQNQSLSLNSAAKQSNQLLKAELELTLGNLKSAQHKLESLLSVKTTTSIKNRSQSLLRELLYAELNKPNQNESPLLAKLEVLATTPLERGRFLSRKSKFLLQQQDYQGLMDVAEEFKKIEVNQPLAMAGDSNHLVTVNSLIAGLMEKIISKADR